MSAAASAMALAHAHGVSISLDGSDLILESRGPISQEVRAAIRQAKANLVALLARRDADQTDVLTGDELLAALRARGFVIGITGSDRDLRDIVAKHHTFFTDLLAWQAPR